MATRVVTLLRVFIPFALGYFLSYLYRTVNAIIAPNLVADLQIDPADLGLLSAAYYLSFAAFQLPLGMLLDRFGPRRVEAALLLFAALGAFVFARAESLALLVVGRALIGLGVSACLMAAFKAFVIWFPSERLPLANGVQMVSGGLGALAATTPIEAALHVTDWRGVFLILSALTILAGLCVLFVVPERDRSSSIETLGEQLGNIRLIFTSMKFWRIAPWALFCQATFLAIVGLWSGPWLRDVARYDRADVADTLLVISVAMIAGFILLGALAEHLSRRGIEPMTVALSGMGGFALVQIFLVLQWTSSPRLLWMLFGFLGTSSILPYAVLSQSFPPHLSGRANTALNLLVFAAAFGAQWGIGAIINLWPQTAAGGFEPAGYQVGFGILTALQLLGALWYWGAGRGRKGVRCTG
ncbi:MAG: MFS transporter [bacterium]|nr:MFS transporter [bacterium]